MRKSEEFGSVLFDDIIGNDKAKAVLTGALDTERVSHAYLFQGPVGVGKFTVAFEFAKAVMGLPDTSSQDILDFSHPDLAIIRPEGPTLTVKIGQVREITRAVAMRPALALRKVFIIDGADRMTDEAANSILKTLEEPPSFIVIILVSSVPPRVLPTIRSRCSAVAFAPVGEESLRAHLMEIYAATESAASFFARLSAGSVGLAVSAMHDEEFISRRSRLLHRLAGAADFTLLDILQFCQEFGETKEFGPEVARTMRSWFRDILLVHALGDSAGRVITNTDFAEVLSKSASAWSSDRLVRLLEHLAEFETALSRTRGNANLKLAMEAFMLKALFCGEEIARIASGL